jgi:uncharacterized protein (TIGR00369 family)
MDDLLTRGRSALASQAFSRLIGTELVRYDTHGAELRLQISDQLKQQHGFVHGGLLAYLADNALTFAGGAAMGGNVVTGEMKINYLRPALGEYLVARASCISNGRSVSVARCEIYAVAGGTERLCAAAQGSINRLPDPKP